MEIQFAVSKISKWASRESGDTLEMIERPHGGLSMVLVDGQMSGRSAKAISNVVARKAIQLLGEGVRDGAAARAAHDYLYIVPVVAAALAARERAQQPHPPRSPCRGLRPGRTAPRTGRSRATPCASARWSGQPRDGAGCMPL